MVSGFMPKKFPEAEDEQGTLDWADLGIPWSRVASKKRPTLLWLHCKLCVLIKGLPCTEQEICP